jgi:hypothetical protein
MRIENNAQTLDQEIKRLLDSTEHMNFVKQGLESELDKLYSSGFKDRKFEELRLRVKDSEAIIMEMNKTIKGIIDSLKQRSALIRKYHSVNI